MVRKEDNLPKCHCADLSEKRSLRPTTSLPFLRRDKGHISLCVDQQFCLDGAYTCVNQK